MASVFKTGRLHRCLRGFLVHRRAPRRNRHLLESGISRNRYHRQ